MRPKKRHSMRCNRRAVPKDERREGGGGKESNRRRRGACDSKRGNDETSSRASVIKAIKAPACGGRPETSSGSGRFADSRCAMQRQLTRPTMIPVTDTHAYSTRIGSTYLPKRFLVFGNDAAVAAAESAAGNNAAGASVREHLLSVLD